MRGEGECISRRKNSAQSLGKPFPFPRLKDFFIQLIHARASPACTTWWACLLLLWIFRTFESDKMWSVALSSKGHERVISSPQLLLITSISFSFPSPSPSKNFSDFEFDWFLRIYTNSWIFNSYRIRHSLTKINTKRCNRIKYRFKQIDKRITGE